MVSFAEEKFMACLRLARETRRDAWRGLYPQKYLSSARTLSREAMADARYWRDLIRTGESK